MGTFYDRVENRVRLREEKKITVGIEINMVGSFVWCTDFFVPLRMAKLALFESK